MAVCTSSGFMKSNLGGACCTVTKPFSSSLPVRCNPNFGLQAHSRGFFVRTQARKGAQQDVDIYGESVADDYYAVLGVMPTATQTEIKRAYYNCMKECHPDLGGTDVETTSFCMFVNEVYEVLSDPAERLVYDDIHGYTLNRVNPFSDESQPKDHVFVDEFTCIGCKNCANIAPDVFKIEEDHGRARAYCQKGLQTESVGQAVESCPVDCIHWTSAAQLSLLEDEMRKLERVNVGLMLSGMGFRTPDVFAQASTKWEKRQRKAAEQAKVRMWKEKHKGKEKSYWDGLWDEAFGTGAPKADETRERASRAAAAARKWREYSRKGVDRRPTCSLPASKLQEELKETQPVK